MGALSRRNDDPQRASRPFDADRDGFVIAEGAAVLVLEERDAAVARGAEILAELAGYAATCDAFHLTQPDPEGTGAASRCAPRSRTPASSLSDVGYINAHGTSTPFNDKIESLAIRSVFGADAPPVSSTKSATGHLTGAAGAIEAVFSILALRTKTLPPTINYDTPDPECDLDYVPNNARETAVEHVLSNSFGFGGHNACLVVQEESSATNRVHHRCVAGDRQRDRVAARVGRDSIAVGFFRNKTKAAEVCAEIEGLGVKAVPIKVHVGDLDAVERAFDEVGEVFGSLDVFVSNAASGVLRDLEDIDARGWQWTMDINARAFLFGAKRAAALMSRRRLDRRADVRWVDQGAPGLRCRRCVEGGTRGARALPRRRAADGIRVNAGLARCRRHRCADALPEPRGAARRRSGENAGRPPRDA